MTLLVESDHPGRKGLPPHFREDLRRRHRHAAAATEFARTLDVLNFSQLRIAKLLNMSPRHIRRLRHGDRSVPHTVGLVLNLLVAGVISIDQAEAAAPAPVRANGSASPASLRLAPAPEPAKAAATSLSVPIEPAPELSALAATEAPSVGTAAQVRELAAGECRYPIGDPARPAFRFCCAPIARGAYCEEHYRLTHMTIERRPSAPFRLGVRTTLTARKRAVAV